MPVKTQKTKVIQTRLPEDLVNQANEILDYIGLSATDAVRILFKNIVNNNGLPFELTKPATKIPIPKNPPILDL
jgi:addiction module RelB/DinJ family antitoxin